MWIKLILDCDANWEINQPNHSLGYISSTEQSIILCSILWSVLLTKLRWFSIKMQPHSRFKDRSIAMRNRVRIQDILSTLLTVSYWYGDYNSLILNILPCMSNRSRQKASKKFPCWYMKMELASDRIGSSNESDSWRHLHPAASQLESNYRALDTYFGSYFWAVVNSRFFFVFKPSSPHHPPPPPTSNSSMDSWITKMHFSTPLGLLVNSLI